MKRFIAALIGNSLIFLLFAIARAGSAQWDLNPGSGDWNTAANWTPMTVPNGSADTATFALSNTTNVSISANTEVNGITFTPAATNPYTITASSGFILTVSGTGITNNSGVTQSFVAAGSSQGARQTKIIFTNSATAGSSVIFTNEGATFFYNSSTAGGATFTNTAGTNGGFGAVMEFSNSSTAANGTFTNNGTPSAGALGGLIIFNDNATAAHGSFTNNGGMGSSTCCDNGGIVVFDGNATAADGVFVDNGGTVSGAYGGATFFETNTTAGRATITNNGAAVGGARGGFTSFSQNSTAGSATLIANGGINGGEGGVFQFYDHSTGGTSRVELFGNGNLDISNHSTHTTTPIGSIEGDGNAFLGANNLTVGSNNMSTTFSGVIQDGGFVGGVGGSLTKVGAGTLDLTGANTYTGVTNISGGVLKVDGSITSNTFVNPGGTLAGKGTIYGNVRTFNGGTVRPGDSPGTLTVNGNYSQPAGTLLIDIAGPNSGQFSILNVLGSAKLSGILDPRLLSGFIPTVGERFIFLKYGSLFGGFGRIQHRTFDNGMEHWAVTYQSTDAILTVRSGPVPVPDYGSTSVPDYGSTFLLLTLSLLGLATYRQKCWQ